MIPPWGTTFASMQITTTPTRNFIRHYIEMVIAMLVGMAVLGAPAGLVVDYHATAQMLGAMAITMTVPMAAWMRYRGHGWAPTAEMSAAMILPALGVMGLFTADLVTDVGALMLLEHVVMLAAMLGAMLLRRDEYTHHHAGVEATA
jgi:hypothetical protein